jgi:ubiquinone/menaquinone biosynthesis C-methylase UbiE
MDDPKIKYHIEELEVARNRELPHHVVPDYLDRDRAILDIGCGIGQTFIASNLENGRLLVGLDIDLDSLLYGRNQFGHINYANGTAKCLPFQNNSFNFVISRVSQPYTNIPESLVEIKRVLKEGGRVWFTLHPFSMTLRHLERLVLKFRVRKIIFCIYVIANGIVFHLFGKLFAFPFRNRYESFQTKSGITRVLKNIGFTNVAIQRGKHFLVSAQKQTLHTPAPERSFAVFRSLNALSSLSGGNLRHALRGRKESEFVQQLQS